MPRVGRDVDGACLPYLLMPRSVLGDFLDGVFTIRAELRSCFMLRDGIVLMPCLPYIPGTELMPCSVLG